MNLLWIIIKIIKTKKSIPQMKRLDHRVIPSFYELDLDVNENGFSGRVSIQCIKKTEGINEFIINSKDLIIKHIDINEIDCKFEINEENILIKHKIINDFKINIEFEGKYSEGMDGFYKSKYKDKILYSTHFEPTDARKMFPCFDQPDMKAKFCVNIHVPDGYIALSNTKCILKDNGWYKFENTPIMSTYLLAIVIGELKNIEIKAGKFNIPIRVWAYPDEVKHGYFAINVAKCALNFYEKFFGIKYELEKLDMVAIPEFSMGAMENWGLITYRSSSLLYHEGQTSLRSKKNIAITVAHELAHMWFGNLVTMRWWDELWLNEGFATWAASLALQESVQELLPMDYWAAFINDETESGLHSDALRNTHAVQSNDIRDINQLFDAISYSKGASIIRMLERYLGKNIFQRGLQKYFEKFKYLNTIKDDLWLSLTHAVNEDKNIKNNNISLLSVKQLIDPWINQEGFPWINVIEEIDGLHLQQSRFTLGFSENKQFLWPIPLRIFWDINNLQNIIMEKSEIIIPYNSKILNKSFFKLNYEGSGFYRIKYSEQTFNRLIKSNLSNIEKLNLLADRFSLGFACLCDFPFNYLDIFINETNYEVILILLDNLVQIKHLFYDDLKKQLYLQNQIFKIINPRLKSINLISNNFYTVNDISVATLFINIAVTMNSPIILNKLRNLLTSEGFLNPNFVHKEYLRSYFIANVDTHFDQLFKISQEKSFISSNALFAIGFTTNINNLHIIFNNFELLPRQDVIYLFSGFSSNILLRHEIMNLFILNYEKIKKYISDYNLLRTCLERLFSVILQKPFVDTAINFLHSLESDKKLSSAIENSFDSINYKIRLRTYYNNKPFN